VTAFTFASNATNGMEIDFVIKGFALLPEAIRRGDLHGDLFYFWICGQGRVNDVSSIKCHVF
jgi:hypothetical protein